MGIMQRVDWVSFGILLRQLQLSEWDGAITVFCWFVLLVPKGGGGKQYVL